MDAVDRALVNRLQAGIGIAERPFADVAAELGLAEEEVPARIARLLEDGVLSRFGPMYDAERLGGCYSLVAMRVDDADFERVADAVNRHPEVAHNYARSHAFNMWFVVAAESRARVAAALAAIEAETGCRTVDLPRLDEYFIGLRFDA